MTPKRIAYVLNIFPKISETFIAGELAELRRRGVELRILSLQPPRQEPQHEIIRRARLDRLVEYDASKFADVVRAFQPELLHAHFAREATAKARELSGLTGIPFTFTAHGYDIHRKPPPDFRERALAARAVVTVSQANKEYIEQTFGVARQHVHVIPCGVDTERFCPGTGSRGRESAEFPRDQSHRRLTSAATLLVVCVARHVAVKNLGLLLDACALLRDRGVKFRCVMVGDGPLRAELEAKRGNLGLQEIVEVPGAAEQGEVLRWWQRASVGVLTSDNEGMPVSLMEAAACGVPVVATRVGGIPELVVDGVTGLLSSPGDATAFASVLERILGDAPLRERMSVAARQRAVEQFSVARQVEVLLSLWDNVLPASCRRSSIGSPGETSAARLESGAITWTSTPSPMPSRARRRACRPAAVIPSSLVTRTLIGAILRRSQERSVSDRREVETVGGDRLARPLARRSTEQGGKLPGASPGAADLEHRPDQNPDHVVHERVRPHPEAENLARLIAPDRPEGLGGPGLALASGD